jgi:GTP-binding protein HflX
MNTLNHKLTTDNSSTNEIAYLIGVSTKKLSSINKEESSIAELKTLVESAGAQVIGIDIQKREFPHPKSFIGSGKLETISEIIKLNKVNVLVVNSEISGSQQMFIEKKLGIKVIDRSSVILDIFANRAKSKEALLQVSLAQHEYLLPRLRGQWTHLERFSGGIGNRGPGETQLETDRRLVAEKISLLKKKIKKIYKHRELIRNKRKKNLVPDVGIIGYTNAGKSSLMTALSKRKPSIANRPFETLDTTIGKIWVKDNIFFTVTDTVGFYSNLPIELVSAFKATIEEIANSDLLIHVIDSSSPNIINQLDSVYMTINDLNLLNIPMISIFNKIDCVNEMENFDNIKALMQDKIWY